MAVVKLYCAIVGVVGSVFSVRVNDAKSVDDLKVAIKADQELEGPASKLQPFLAKVGGIWVTVNDVKNGVGNTAGMKHLDNDQAELRDVGLSGKEIRFDDRIVKATGNGPVNVLVKLSTTSSIRMTGESAEVAAEVELYEGVAQNLKGSTEVNNLVEIIKTIQEDSKAYGDVTMPFIVLENSSGTGKTQMAINLQATEECDLFYMLCTSQKDRYQTVYGAFEKRAAAFKACILKDAEKLLGDKKGSVSDFIHTSSLLVYSFIISALRGLDVVSGLEATRQDVESVLEHREKANKPPFVVFLDEFPRVGDRKGDEKDEQTKQARMMRNVFRSFHIVVVASATNGTARDLMDLSTNSRDVPLSGVDIPWCVVVPSLPGFATTMTLDPNTTLDPTIHFTVPSNEKDGGMLLSGECKDRGTLDLDTMKQILKRVPEETPIHLVMVQVLQSHYFTSDNKKSTPAVPSATKQRGSKKNLAQSDVGANAAIGKQAAATNVQSGVASMASSKPVSASEYLKQVNLQHADFYRISKNGGVQEFQELMLVNDAGVHEKKTGAGKLILFVEVGTITKKRDLDEGEQVAPAKRQKKKQSGEESKYMYTVEPK